jgi:two-component system KDP operon response regulator KdpE
VARNSAALSGIFTRTLISLLDLYFFAPKLAVIPARTSLSMCRRILRAKRDGMVFAKNSAYPFPGNASTHMSKLSPCIVIIDDDLHVRRVLRSGLTAHDFIVHEADDGKRGLTVVATRKPDLVILDLGLPDMDGVEVLQRLREWTAMPIIVLSGRTQEADKVAAYAGGVDDYLEKPFGLLELLARIRVALRRAVHSQQLDADGLFSVADLKVNLALRRVTLDGRRIHLSPLEYRLLAVLIKHADKVVTHRQLLTEVWGPGYQEHVEYLRIYIQSLRRKLEMNSAQPRFLLTEPGTGYRLSTEVTPAVHSAPARLTTPNRVAPGLFLPQA